MKKVEKTRRRFLRGLKKLLKENNVWLAIGDGQRVVACIPHSKFLVGVGLICHDNINGEVLEITK
jgi:hypothetical protein